jgi:glycosyltransferase involved in cell wall biosynthesis
LETPTLTVCLYSFDESEWMSCKRIVTNLVGSYKKSFGTRNIKFLNFSRKHTEIELLQLADEILRLAPGKIIFLDHQPHPVNLLTLLLPSLESGTHLIFHAYGDFLLPYPQHWVSLGKSLQNFKLTFLNASDRQRNYFEQFIKQPSISFICPFPVNSLDFFYSKTEREAYRRKLSLKENDFVWLYAGRLSLQKNIIKLVEDFAKFKTLTGSSDKLFLVGQFDNVGVPYLEISQKEHEYFYHYNQALLALDETIRKDICHLGVYYGNELNGIYNSADAFISLGTYNDEDFGMAAAEALSTGLPCLLTDWAGYSSFPKYAPVNQVQLLQVKFVGGLFTYRNEDLYGLMLNIKKTNVSREKVSRAVNSKLSIGAVADILAEILAAKVPKFGGFSKDLNKLAQRWNTGHTFCTPKKSYNGYYKKIYETYFC